MNKSPSFQLYGPSLLKVVGAILRSCAALGTSTGRFAAGGHNITYYLHDNIVERNVCLQALWHQSRFYCTLFGVVTRCASKNEVAWNGLHEEHHPKYPFPVSIGARKVVKQIFDLIEPFNLPA